MKKLITILGAMIIASIIFTSCGGGKNKKSEFNIKPNSTAIKGDLSDFFEVVDGTYKLEKAEGENAEFKIKVQFKRKEKSFDFDAKDLESRGYFQLCSNLLGDGGTPIVLGSTEGMGEGTARDGRKELTTIKPGETNWVEFTFSSNPEMEKVKTFEVNSTVRKDQQMSSSSSTSPSSVDESSSTSSSVDCDKFIKTYEEFANSYIKLLKKYKANPSDATILSEYSEAAQKATEMQSNASNCTDPKYASKIMEIANRIAKAAM